MFTRINVPLVQDPKCTQALTFTPNKQDFRYYDKDGFELCQAELKYYELEGHPVDQPILNHRLWQEEWLTIDHSTLLLDHAMILHRCSFEDDAQEQLFKLKKTIPQADLLLRTKQQWGYDFDLDCIGPNGEIFEVLHIEMDFNDFNNFEAKLYDFEDRLDQMDWEHAAERIWSMKDQWQHLKGFSQNDWKANYLLGQEKSEYTEKAV